MASRSPSTRRKRRPQITCRLSSRTPYAPSPTAPPQTQNAKPTNHSLARYSTAQRRRDPTLPTPWAFCAAP
eukprot:3103287-Pleurochrysis_carterae.AAC.1